MIGHINNKRNRKRRSDEVDIIKGNKPGKIDMKKLKSRKPVLKIGVKPRKFRNAHNSDEDDIEEPCAADSCLQSSGEEVVQWVQCDGGCEQWFHMACVGLTAKDINEDEDYICIFCSEMTVRNGYTTSQEFIDESCEYSQNRSCSESI